MCFSPRGLLGLNGGSLMSMDTEGDRERDLFASGPTSSLFLLLGTEEEAERTIDKSFEP